MGNLRLLLLLLDPGHFELLPVLSLAVQLDLDLDPETSTPLPSPTQQTVFSINIFNFNLQEFYDLH